MQNAFREPMKREKEDEVPVYHVSHDTPYAPKVPRPRKELYDELRKNQGEPEEESVPIPMTDMKYGVPVYQVTHEQEELLAKQAQLAENDEPIDDTSKPKKEKNKEKELDKMKRHLDKQRDMQRKE